MSQGADSVKSIIYALTANLLIAVAKLIAAAISGSGAMLAEGIHSIADSSNQLLLLLGIKRAKKPPNEDYPLGFGRSIYFWSFIVALILFSVGGMFSLYEGWHKLSNPEALNHPWIAISVLIFAIFAEGASLWGCIREINKVRGKRSLWRWFRDSRQSELLVIFGEDIAALLGLAFALVAIAMTMITGNPAYDALGSIVIGILLIVVAIFIGIEVKALLIGMGVEAPIKQSMTQFLKDRPEIDTVLNLLTLHIGNDVMVAVKAKMSETSSVEQLIQDINHCESDFKQAFPEVMWLFFEPDTHD